MYMLHGARCLNCEEVITGPETDDYLSRLWMRKAEELGVSPVEAYTTCAREIGHYILLTHGTGSGWGMPM